MNSNSLLTKAIKNELPNKQKTSFLYNDLKKVDSQTIIHNYGLNKNFIDPNSCSPPNFFMEKLQNRMKNYFDVQAK